MFKKIYVYLKDRLYRKREGDRGEDLPSFGSLPQMTTSAGARLNQTQEPGAHAGSPTGVQGTGELGHMLLLQAISRELDH